MKETLIPTSLTFEEIVRDFWNSDPSDPRDAALQTELFWTPEWVERYGCWGEKIGRLIPEGLVIGSWEIIQRDDVDEIVARWRTARLITTAGKNALAAYLALASPSGPFMRYLSTGTGNAAPAVGDTALGGAAGNPITEIGTSTAANRLAGTASSAANVYQVQGTTPSGRYAGQNLQEAGIHDALAVQTVAGTPSGAMYDRALLAPAAIMGASDTLQLTFQITFT